MKRYLSEKHDSDEDICQLEDPLLVAEKIFKCDFCDKTSPSMPGLKGHMTKIAH